MSPGIRYNEFPLQINLVNLKGGGGGEISLLLPKTLHYRDQILHVATTMESYSRVYKALDTEYTELLD